MKVYITGHNGFVGKSLIRKLNEQGYNIITSHIDLKNQEIVNNFFELIKPDWVFHCAAVVGGIGANIKEPYKFLFDNLQIQNNVIDNCIKHKVKKVLFLGSSCIFPKNYRQPLIEEDLLAAPVETTNEGYAIAKIAGLKLCEYANRVQDITKFISLMPCNLYGPGDHFDLERSHVISALIMKIYDAYINHKEIVDVWGSGNPRREFLYIEDLVDGMIWAMNNIAKTDTFLNIGVGYDISIKEIANKIADIIGYVGNFYFNLSKPDGMMKRRLDVSKINSLGWIEKTSFDDGLKYTIEYYRGLYGKIENKSC